ncbi:MAG: GAF domain-containing protein [Gammaproteobacteria bacterium]|jgi:GAF domain-containing protein
MFDSLKREIDTLDIKQTQLDADWGEGGGNALLAFYIKMMPKVLNAERCNIFIYDPTAKVIWLKAGTGIEESGIYVGEEAESLPGEVVKSGEHKILHEIKETDEIHKALDEKTGLVTRNLLAIPIMSVDRKKVMGAVEVLNKVDGSAFTDADRQMLEEMAHYLEVAIENIIFNMEATSLLRKTSRTLTIIGSAILWLIGLGILAIIGRLIWAGLHYTIS